MTSCDARQALCGPFSSDDFPSFQAAIEHLESQWRETLPVLAGRIVYAAICLTAKFNRTHCRPTARLLRRGLKRNHKTGFSGMRPFFESEQAINAALRLLYEVGVFVKDARGRTAIDYSVNALDLVKHEDVAVSVKKRNSHNPLMRTIEGIIAWAERIAEILLPEQAVAVAGVGAESYSFSYRTTTSSKGKPFSEIWGDVVSKADEIKSAILASVAERSNRLHEQRSKRMSIADMCNLFEDAWRKGQHERDRTILASRLVARDRRLLKDQIVYPARELAMDISDFAHWVALHWDAIGATYFKKAKAYPSSPAFRWLIRCLETYTTAYQRRDSLDPTGKLPDAQRVSTEALAALSQRTEKAISAQAADMDDLRRQLDAANRENAKLKQDRGLPVEDDPVYNRIIAQAKRKVVVRGYDDEDVATVKPVKRIIKKGRRL